jgi:undecaprenyl-diphosphatase
VLATAAAAPAHPHIPVLHAIVLGITQGLSEFFPISSSGHLILVPWLFGWHELDNFKDLNKTFDVALHAGTFIGAVAYFWRDLSKLIPAGLRALVRRSIETTEERLAWLLLLSAVPGAIVGALFEKTIEDNLGQPWLIAVMLIVFALLLFVADRAVERLRYEQFGVREAVIMGFAQAVALQPGVSRSGVTITAGRFLGIERDDVARISFLMSIPIIGGAALYKGAKLVRDGIPAGTGSAFAWGVVASAVTGLIAIYLVFRILKTRSYTPFVVYRILAGLAVLGIILSGFRPAS